MAKKLFVGNLSWNTTDQSLQDFFATAGNVVSAHVITDRNTGRSRGFGFVEMSSDEEAQAAMDLNGKQLDGREIVVNEAREREDRGGSGGGGGERRFNNNYSNNKGGGYRDHGRNDNRGRRNDY
jgi:RNA recognition motif-containing protein